MKTLTLMLVLVVTAGAAQAQTVDEVRQQMIERTPPNLELASDWQPAIDLEREAARNRRNGGIALTVLGIGLEVTAGALWGYVVGTSTADDLANAFGAHPPQHHDTTAAAYTAAGCAVFGVAAVVGGIDLWVTGQRRLNRLVVTPTFGGATATLAF